jgi:acyl-CoA hydrolase
MTTFASSAAEAIQAIPEGARIVVPPGPAGPASLLAALGDRRWAGPIELFCGAGRLPASILENPQIRIFDWQFSGGARALFQSGRIDYVPLRYSDFPRAFGQGGALAADVLLMQIPPVAGDGRLSPGLCGAIGFDLIHSVPLAIAEVNAALPFTRTPVVAQESDIDFAIEVETSRAQAPRDAPSEVELADAANVASVVADGATLQFGTGSVVEAVLARLGNHRNLGIHSGMVTDGILPLIQSGAINNSAKRYMDGVTVAGMAFGSPAFLEFMDDNEEFAMVPAGISHGGAVLSQLNSFTTINSAIEVDLTGQVNAEFMKGSQFSGVGGQADYTAAGSSSARPGCQAIIAMPSATAGGAISRIVPTLCAGAIVTTPRYCVDFVITEYGVADLRFQPLRERAKRLIAVAHPAHREALARHISSQPGPT